MNNEDTIIEHSAGIGSPVSAIGTGVAGMCSVLAGIEGWGGI